MSDTRSNPSNVNPDDAKALALKTLGEMAGVNPNLALLSHNFDVSDPQKLWEVTARATGGQSERASNHLLEKVEIAHWYVHMIEVSDPVSGDPKPAPRIVIFDQSGKSYQAVSSGVLSSLITLVHCFGVGPYDPCPIFNFYESETRNRYKILQFGPMVSDDKQTK